MKKYFLINACLVLFSDWTTAQARDPEIESRLDTIVVEAFRSGRSLIEIPYSSDYIIAADKGRSEPGKSLDELFFSVPGVIVNNRFNPSLGDRITIRGVGSRASFGVRGIKIILDNIPLTMPDGQSQLNNLDFGSIGSIEIIRGPSSSLYGNASGGVINIKTENPLLNSKTEKISLSFEPEYLAGSYGFQRIDGKFSGSIDKFSYLVNLSKLNSDGYREHSDETSYNINSVFNYKITPENNLKWIFSFYDSPYSLNPGSLNKSDAANSPQMARDIVKQQGSGQQTTQLQTGISSSVVFSSQTKIESSIYFVSRDLLNPITGRIIDLNRNAGGIRTALNQSVTLADLKMNFILGTDVEIQIDDRIEYVNLGLPDIILASDDPSVIFDNLRYGDKLLDQTETVVGVGPFVQSEIGFSAFTILFGLRYNNYRFEADDKFFDDGTNDSGTRIMEKVSPSAGINFRINDLTKLFVNYSTSFQTPTTTELGNRPDGQGGFNPDLLPEDIYSLETGFLSYGLFDHLNLNISVFHMGFTNMLIPYQVSGSEEIFFANAGKAENEGVELVMELFPFIDVSTQISYSFSNFVFKDYLAEYEQNQFQLSGNALPGIPSHKLSAMINYQTEKGFFGSLKLLWVDKFFTNDFNGPPPGVNEPQTNFVNENYFDAGIRLGYLLKSGFMNTEIFIGVNNLFNERYSSSIIPNAIGYRFFEPAPDRNWFAGIKLIFPGSIN